MRARLPRTDSIGELAAFWDSHSLTDFEDELEEVAGPVFERPGTPVLVRLDPVEAQAIERLARDRGIDRSELLRGWVREKLAAVRP